MALSENLPPSAAGLYERSKRWPIIGANPIAAPGLLLLLIWAIFNAALTVRTIVRDYNPLPVWDYWQIADHLQRYKAFDWSVLWVQHNEHRIVFPEMIFAIDTVAFHGSQVFALCVSFACYFGIWSVTAAALYTERSLSVSVKRAAVLFAFIIMFWQGSSVVLGNTFLLQWTMAQFAVTLSFALLAYPRRSHVYVGLAILSAVVATYSSGNGLLLWPLLIAAALVLRRPKSTVFALVISGVLSVGLYFINYRSSNDLHIWNLIRHPIYTLGFICSYLGMPVGALGQPGIAVCSGAFVLLGFSYLLWCAARKRMLTTLPGVVLFGSFLFTVATALLTAAGRMNPADPKFLAALAARYVSLPIVNWAMFLVALLWVAGRLKWQSLTPAMISLLACLSIFGIVRALRPWVRGNGSFIAEKQVATISIENQLRDPDLEAALYPDQTYIAALLPILEKDHAFLFSDRAQQTWIGKSAKSLFTPCDKPAEGSIIGSYPVLGGIEIVGNMPATEKNSTIVFVDQTGKVAGIGNWVEAGVPEVSAGKVARGSVPWVGFVNEQHNANLFSTYLVSGDKLCLLRGPQQITGARQVSLSEVASPIDGVSFAGAGWMMNATSSPGGEPNPTGASFFSSWNGSDASTGTIASSAFTSPNGCVALPVLHGPVITGLHLRVEYTDRSIPAEEIPLRPGESGWKFWKILTPHSGAEKIVAQDRGAGWGQWLAIALPRACK